MTNQIRWNVFHLDDHRTNNDLEGKTQQSNINIHNWTIKIISKTILIGWHHRMALELKAKSNLWAFIRGIKEEHIAKEVEMRQILQGNIIKPRRLQQKQKEEILLRLKTLYIAGDLTPMQYNNNLSNRMQQN